MTKSYCTKETNYTICENKNHLKYTKKKHAGLQSVDNTTNQSYKCQQRCVN